MRIEKEGVGERGLNRQGKQKALRVGRACPCPCSQCNIQASGTVNRKHENIGTLVVVQR